MRIKTDKQRREEIVMQETNPGSFFCFEMVIKTYCNSCWFFFMTYWSKQSHQGEEGLVLWSHFNVQNHQRCRLTAHCRNRCCLHAPWQRATAQQGEIFQQKTQLTHTQDGVWSHMKVHCCRSTRKEQLWNKQWHHTDTYVVFLTSWDSTASPFHPLWGTRTVNHVG